MFDGVLLLGVCDKIVPGLLMGALHFGHLPCILIPAGPMTSGISNSEKAKIRELYATGQVGREALLASEARAYHGAGTCTFYGTANSNQMLMEIMGLHIPGTAFINPGTALREALTGLLAAVFSRSLPRSLASEPSGRCWMSAVLSTPLPACGRLVARPTTPCTSWPWREPLASNSPGMTSPTSPAVVPLLARIYPNGSADVNHFHAAGGLGFIIRELLDAGLLHEDVCTIMGPGLRAYTREPWLDNGTLSWREVPATIAR